MDAGLPRRPAPRLARRAAFLLAALALAEGALAEDALPPVEYPDILVTGWRPSAGVPERSLEGGDVEAYGLGTIGELLAEVAAEDGETPGDAAFLVNGRRVSGLAGLSDLPAEAIDRIDILPRGSGVAVGASPRQRVYAIRLRRKLDLVAARAAARMPTRGGWSSRRGEVVYSRLRAERRLALAAKARQEPMLLESERDIVQPAALAPEAGAYRTLLPATERLDLSLSAADRLVPWLSGSLVSKLSLARRHALLGPFPAGAPAQPLDQRGRTLSASVDLGLDAEAGSWQFGLFANVASLNGRTTTDRPLAAVRRTFAAITGSTVRTLSVLVSAFGPLLDLPAGSLLLNLGAGASRDTIQGRRVADTPVGRRRTVVTATSVSAAIELPIASRSAGALTALGDLSASAEIARHHASDFGSFGTYALALLWRPTEWLGLTGSLGRSDSAPPVSSLDEPPLETPGVRVFDPRRGETVDVTWITGGSPALRRQRDETRRLAVNLKPFRALALRLNAEYSETRNRNLVSELPGPGPAAERAFPDRFIRDGHGRLIAVDARPVSFAARNERQLRAGLVLTLPLGQAGPGGRRLAEEEEEDEPRAPPPRTAVRPRLQVSASFSRLLASALSIRPGEPAIDLLSRDALAFGGLGQPRHRFDASLGYAGRGLGIRASVQTRGASLVEASGSSANILRFHPLSLLSLRAWIQGERLAPGARLLKGTRLSLSLLNLGDARGRVEDRFGVTPLSYQPAYRDPIGRSVELELRKKF